MRPTALGDFGARIGDEGGPNPDIDYGNPYWAAIRRGHVEDGKDPCLNNADNYVGYALEMYWTNKFKESLLDQGGHLKIQKIHGCHERNSTEAKH